MQNPFVYVLSSATLDTLAETITFLRLVRICGCILNFNDVGKDLDHLRIGKEALEELFFILCFHLAHQNVLKFVKVKLLFPDRFGIS